MIIERPDRISHGDDVPIYCLDASEGRLATGGGDGRVRLWATSVLMDSDASFTDVDGDGKDAGGGAGAARATAAGDGAAEGAGSEADQLDASRTLLSVLVGHDAPISCVRWSPSEVYLASGSDDGAVLLWERNQGLSYASAAFGGAPDAGKQGTENWSRVTNLRGHTADVCDIAWAPDGLVLASCSIDNHVLIWAAPGHPLWSTAPTQSPMRQLRGHKGWVKGLAYDPLGIYLGSFGEDRQLLVWRVADWKVEAQVTEPFTEASEAAMFRRPSWGPDGRHLCCPTAVKAGAHIASVLTRGTWSPDVDFVGHTMPVVCARFNPNIFRSPKKASGAVRTCCAVGSQDCSISVWLSTRARPVAVLKNVFTRCVSDLAWHPNGLVLFASSVDGRVASISFTEKELAGGARALTRAQVQSYFETTYGKRATAPVASLPETPDELARADARAGGARLPGKSAPPRAAQSPVVRRLTASEVKAAQVEVAGGQGKRRRIQPVLVQGVASAAVPPASAGAGSWRPFGHSSPSSTAAPAALNGIEARFTAPLHSGSAPTGSTARNGPAGASAGQTKGATGGARGGKQTGAPKRKRTTSIQADGAAGVRQRGGSGGGGAGAGAGGGVDLSQPTLAFSNGPAVASHLSAAVTSAGGPGVTTAQQTVFTVPSFRATVAVRVPLAGAPPGAPGAGASTDVDDGDVAVVTAKFTADAAEEGLDSVATTIAPASSTVSCALRGSQVWQCRVPAVVCALAACGDESEVTTVAAACDDGTVYIIGRGGVVSMPALVVGHTACALSARRITNGHGVVADGHDVVAVVTAGAEMRCWDVTARTSLCAGSASPLVFSLGEMQRRRERLAAASGHVVGVSPPLAQVSLQRVSISRAGKPIVFLRSAVTDTMGFVFEAQMDCWLRVVDNLHIMSDVRDPMPAFARAGGGEVAATLATAAALTPASRATESAGTIARAMLSAGDASSRAREQDTTAELELRIATAGVFGGEDEALMLMKRYTRHLAACGDEVRLRVLFDTMLQADKKDGASTLPTLLDEAREQGGVQRVVAEYVDALEADAEGADDA